MISPPAASVGPVFGGLAAPGNGEVTSRVIAQPLPGRRGGRPAVGA